MYSLNLAECYKDNDQPDKAVYYAKRSGKNVICELIREGSGEDNGEKTSSFIKIGF